MRVAVLGAGITGLATAYLLLRRGAEVTIYEAAPRSGGLGGSFRSGDFVFDFGPHEIVTDDTAIHDLLEEVCGEELLTVRKRTAQHFRGRFVGYPLGLADLLVRIRPDLTARVLCGVALARVRNLVLRPPDASFADWTRARFGTKLYQLYFEPYTRKVWGVDPKMLDPKTASDRITVDSLWDLARKTLGYRLLRRDYRGLRHSEFHRTFRYTRGGIGTLQRRLAEHVRAHGGRILPGMRAAGLERRGRTVRRIMFAGGAKAGPFDHVVSTIPLPALARMALEDRAEEILRRAPLPFRGLVFVFLRIARPKLTDYHWIYFPEPALPFQRCTEFSHFGAGMCPPGATGVALEVPGSPGEDAWTRPDAEIAGRCIEALVALGLLAPDQVLGFDVVRVRHAYPVQVVGFAEHAREVLDAIAEVAENVVSIGRQGLFRYCNMDECLAMAAAVAPRIAAGEHRVRHTATGSWRGVGVLESR